MLAGGRHVFGRRPKTRAVKPREKRVFRAGHYKDLTETGNGAKSSQVKSSHSLFKHGKIHQEFKKIINNLTILNKSLWHPGYYFNKLNSINFQDGVNDFDVGVNESTFFSFVCRITNTNAQKCY